MVDWNELFDWDKANIEHIARHGVESYEVEEALLDPERVARDARNVRGEVRRAVLGAAEAGRILFVLYTIRNEKIRPVMSRDATDGEKRAYRRRNQ